MQLVALKVIPVVVAFSVGFVVSAVLRQNQGRKRRKRVMTTSDAINVLQSKGKLNRRSSSVDNAACFLASVLVDCNDDVARASILFAIDVLKSERSVALVPLDLSLGTPKDSQSTQQPTIDSRAPEEQHVIDWLKNSYTRINEVRPKLTFQEAAKTVKLAVSVSRAFHLKPDAAYVFDADEAELERINKALDGVDEWGWDVWELHEATKGRPLQAGDEASRSRCFTTKTAYAPPPPCPTPPP